MCSKIDHGLATALGAAALLVFAGSAAAAPRPLKTSLPKAPRSIAAARCADFSFPIYFRDKSDKLTTPARELILQSAAFASACPLSDIKVVGLDSEGPDLSRRRADAVSRALAEGGYPQTGHGILAAEPVSDGAVLASKAEVYVHFANPIG
jgi:outer membrane protein OmpA-like peptidoglycan-associated protein